jgi:hypothetical protein
VRVYYSDDEDDSDHESCDDETDVFKMGPFSDRRAARGNTRSCRRQRSAIRALISGGSEWIDALGAMFRNRLCGFTTPTTKTTPTTRAATTKLTSSRWDPSRTREHTVLQATEVGKPCFDLGW